MTTCDYCGKNDAIYTVAVSVCGMSSGDTTVLVPICTEHIRIYEPDMPLLRRSRLLTDADRSRF